MILGLSGGGGGCACWLGALTEAAAGGTASAKRAGSAEPGGRVGTGPPARGAQINPDLALTAASLKRAPIGAARGRLGGGRDVSNAPAAADSVASARGGRGAAAWLLTSAPSGAAAAAACAAADGAPGGGPGGGPGGPSGGATCLANGLRVAPSAGGGDGTGRRGCCCCCCGGGCGGAAATTASGAGGALPGLRNGFGR